ncbi:hypothetical protein BT63DRAFT_408241 [Microthyrium microscopicum]|uniref:Uncharacterized protein n=1 Tax=Microthyrium microscopicum TaxID=703497 RepID=A0A6A6UQJ7_9PEZI|nr:hypothetical protein BT63DRAFT_408241 [Microthyrium microscopicum]
MELKMDFFQFPGEIRNRIYTFYINDCGTSPHQAEEQKIYTRSNCHDVATFFDDAKKLFLLNKQIYIESRGIFCRLVHDERTGLSYDIHDWATFKRAYKALPSHLFGETQGTLTLLNTVETGNTQPIKQLIEFFAKEGGWKSIAAMQKSCPTTYDKDLNKMVHARQWTSNEDMDMQFFFKVYKRKDDIWEYFHMEGIGWTDEIDDLLQLDF